MRKPAKVHHLEGTCNLCEPVPVEFDRNDGNSSDRNGFGGVRIRISLPLKAESATMHDDLLEL